MRKIRPFYNWRPHPWHGLDVGPNPPRLVNAYIEITPFDLVKYEVVGPMLRVTGGQRLRHITPHDRVTQDEPSMGVEDADAHGQLLEDRAKLLRPLAQRPDPFRHTRFRIAIPARNGEGGAAGRLFVRYAHVYPYPCWLSRVGPGRGLGVRFNCQPSMYASDRARAPVCARGEALTIAQAIIT